MTIKQPKEYLAHVLEAISKIRKYTKDVSREEFFEDGMIQDSVIRRLQVIGEAVKNVPADVLGQDNSVPWRKIASFRDILVHEYFDVDLNEVWGVIKTRLDELEDAVNNLAKTL